MYFLCDCNVPNSQQPLFFLLVLLGRRVAGPSSKCSSEAEKDDCQVTALCWFIENAVETETSVTESEVGSSFFHLFISSAFLSFFSFCVVSVSCAAYC